jgi:hypothetical protein
LGYKYLIHESDDREVFKSQTYTEQITPVKEEIKDRMFTYKFKSLPEGIRVMAGQKYTFAQWMRGAEHCYYTESGNQHKDVESNVDRDLFKIERSELSSNSTTPNRGIIAGVMYELA